MIMLNSEAPTFLEHILSQSPVDTKLLNILLENPEAIISEL